MKPTWKHGVIAGVVISTLIGAGLLATSSSSSQPQSPQSTSTKLPKPASNPPIELPFGGRSVLPEHRLVALYGSGEYASLGALGEQSLEEAVLRTKQVAKEYEPFSEEPIIPTFEIITTVASASKTENKDYSQELDPAKILPWVEKAKAENIYVILDLQPGRSTFLQQAQLYEELLLQPHVGLALDPEWRLLTEKDRHLVEVGSVTATEVNQTSEWLAKLVKDNKLPEKVFMIHQFKRSMIQNREALVTDYEELDYVIHMDGHGALGSKTGTYNRIKENLPENIYLAWKNFYDEDLPTPTPEQTMQQDPKPWFVSYQ